MMRHVSIVLIAAGAVAACNDRADVQCEENANCNLTSGGICATAGTGNRWCAYADPNCPSGYRYSDQDVGDGVSSACVSTTDAGVPSDGATDGPASQLSASCVALPNTCGVSSNDSCCNSLPVPGGTFFRSYDAAPDSHSGDKNSPATISSFRLDKYEITVGRFRAFLADGQGTQAKHPATGSGTHVNIAGSGWQGSWNTSLTFNTTSLLTALKCDSPFQTWTDAAGANENRPINCITWYEAMAFCIWDGGYLPTAAEWNYAATGGDAQRAYPWSSPDAGSLTLSGSYASYSDGPTSDAPNCLGDGMPGCALTDLIAVGTRPMGDGRWGQSDLAGNVDEWTLDYDADYAVPCTDCANLTVSSGRVMFGGDFKNPAIFLRTGFRTYNAPANRFSQFGARCARAP